MNQAVKKVKVEHSPESRNIWIYIGAGTNRSQILAQLRSSVEKILGKGGIVAEVASPGLPSPILEITYYTENSGKPAAIERMVKRFQKERDSKRK